jgi:GTPase SAR1 family protein
MRSLATEVTWGRIVIVGHCASGKTTLVASLRESGYDAYVTAQEHSEIPALWAHLDPDVVIALSVSANEVRRRRTPSWPDWLHHTQTRRLRAAYLAADLLIDTDHLDQEAVHQAVLTFLEAR